MSEVITKEQMRSALSAIWQDLDWRYKCEESDDPKCEIHYQLREFVRRFAEELDLDIRE